MSKWPRCSTYLAQRFSRELGRLRDEGIIDITGRTVKLLNIEEIEEFGF